MPYKDPNSEAAKASMKRRHERYRGTEKAKARMKRYRDAHGRDAYYRFEHGVTEEEFEAQIARQNGLCPIGNHPFGSRGKQGDSPCLDHDHKTGANRMVLCRNHNIALGLFNDSIAELESAILYLKGHEEKDHAECIDN